MRGSYSVVVSNNLMQFKFTVNRNITILRGDSATGKSRLVELVREYSLNGNSSGVTISCDVGCTTLAGIRWQNEIKEIKNSIIFIDEGFDFISSEEFARAIRNSDNYYVIATRESLFNLPYSIMEVYGLKNKTRKSKYQVYDRIYSEFYPLYDDGIITNKPDAVIVEDSNAGYEFFKAICQKEGIMCISAKGKTNVYKTVKDCECGIILVVADGAAFGSEMERAISLRKAKNLLFFLPESFEWLILKSGLIDGSEIQDVLAHPYDFIDSEKYFSWERFFTRLLTDCSKDTYLQYKKDRLNKHYLNKKEMKAIREAIDSTVDRDNWLHIGDGN